MEIKEAVKIRRDFVKLTKNIQLDKEKESVLKKIGIKTDEVGPKTKGAEASGQMTIDGFLLNRQKREGEIKSIEWQPTSIINHEDDFFNWINSMTFGLFPEKIRYDKFEKYKAQAKHWCEEARNPYDEEMQEEKRDIILQEYNRIEENTLYFAMQYNYFAEGSTRAGKMKYVPKEHNAVIFYMLDCGYCFVLGKGRQIFATTTMGIYILKKLVTQENFYMKFITEDEKTGVEILNDKIKGTFRYLPAWQRPAVDRDYIRGFKLGKATTKGAISLPNSRIEVVPPTKTAINAGAPQILFIDEAGQVPDMIPIILEQRPTMYMDINQDGNLKLVRSLILWGTGVTSSKGKHAFYSLWTNVIDLWENKKYESALLVPLFFSWHTRCSEKVYKNAELSYKSGRENNTANFSEEEREHIFRMHYPTVWTDMFAMASNKLVPKSVIDDALKRIKGMKAENKPIAGYFEPIYDRTKPANNDYWSFEFKVIGSRFVPIDDDDNNEIVSCYMQNKPDDKWTNRYYMGTDPISQDTGNSMFASVVWDAEEKNIACLINHRIMQNPKKSFEQALLMSLYYDIKETKIGIPELIENNVGVPYKSFKEVSGYDNNIIYNRELNKDLQGGGTLWGINTKSKRKKIMVGMLAECILKYADNINHDIVFKQLDTYAPKDNSDDTAWGPIDKRLYKDDILDALALAYISAENSSPKQKEEDTQNAGRAVKHLVRNQYGKLTFKTTIA